ncbi:uncharacterized protein V1513DRAFT_437927 [Lipomyces chichibuensis]|uniref:uncharacterized protein n=1 Tax=Lipomyces chichibuensis TaxID=1546026 RepID=UPI00334356B3
MRLGKFGWLVTVVYSFCIVAFHLDILALNNWYIIVNISVSALISTPVCYEIKKANCPVDNRYKSNKLE